MGEVLGVGLSHYPGLILPDAMMAGLLAWTLQDPDIPDAWRDPSRWPATMREEWGDDRGAGAAARHRAELVAALDHVRLALDEFEPDAIVVFGDDQYENFRDDLIPPVAVLAYDDLEVRPWHPDEVALPVLSEHNVWGEAPDSAFVVRGRPDIARHLTEAVLGQGVDLAYAYRPLHHAGLPHAFLNAVLYLDYHRRGFEHPIIPVSVNCYGRRVVSYQGGTSRLGDIRRLDPPSPPPWRLMEVGAAFARAAAASPYRLALVASSSWSHAFLCDTWYRLRPDGDADERLHRWLLAAEYDEWRRVTLDEIEQAGQHEVLNWFVLAGAMDELHLEPHWSSYVRTEIFNSNKVFALWGPSSGR